MPEKEILLSDLLARIPYNVKVSIDGGRPIVLTIGDLDAEAYNTSLDGSVRIKPYLRPMSSMTEEEKKEFIDYASYDIEESVNGRHYEYYLKDGVGTPEEPTCNPDAIDWLNSHHFDYRRLIKRGLALEAPDGMYWAESGIPKDPNILGIKDEFDKDEVMGVLGAVYDFWKAKETENVRNGCGRSGLDGMTTVDVWKLFNQMLTVLHYNISAPSTPGEEQFETEYASENNKLQYVIEREPGFVKRMDDLTGSLAGYFKKGESLALNTYCCEVIFKFK